MPSVWDGAKRQGPTVMIRDRPRTLPSDSGEGPGPVVYGRRLSLAPLLLNAHVSDGRRLQGDIHESNNVSRRVHPNQYNGHDHFHGLGVHGLYP